MRRALIALALLGAAAPLAAQRPLVISPGPQSVSVTVYRNPNRGADEAMDLDWLEGFALITETRTVQLPAGESEVRFEGVAGGIIPASAIAVGLPGGVDEKNRDARLLSSGALVDSALGKRVHIRRTSRATGRITETEAVIRSGPDGIVLQTPDGIEALRCTGIPETLVFGEVPAGLSDKPTLAVMTHSDSAATAEVRLSYLASDFDWQANYIADIAPDGRTLDLFAWLTLANANGESFADAETQAVAGSLNREEDDSDGEPESVATEVSLQCWPQGTTSDVPYAPAPAPPASVGYEMDGSDIIVTGSRRAEYMLESASPIVAIMAEQEELGDLKLYRIPEPVTVAANAQKQIALLQRDKVPFDRLYGASVSVADEQDPEPAEILIRMKNVKAKGLGLPLPTGTVALFENGGGRRMLVGEAGVDDSAIGQDLELTVAESPQVQVTQRLAKGETDDEGEDGKRPRRFEVEISNSNPNPVTVELQLRQYSYRPTRPNRGLAQKDGRLTWLAKVPANGSATLRYTAVRIEEPKYYDAED